MFVGKIKIEAAVMLSNADIDRALGSIKLRAGFEQIERRPDHRRARSGPGAPGSSSAAASFGNVCCEWAKFLGGRLL